MLACLLNRRRQGKLGGRLPADNEAYDHQRYIVRMRGFISFAFLAVLGTWPVCAQEQTRGRSERVKDRGAHEILIADRHWDLLGEGYHLTADSTVDQVGNVYFTDASKNRILKIDLDGNISTWR